MTIITRRNKGVNIVKLEQKGDCTTQNWCTKRAAIDSSTIVLKFVNLIIPNSDSGNAKFYQRHILEKDINVKNHQRFEIHPKMQI